MVGESSKNPGNRCREAATVSFALDRKGWQNSVVIRPIVITLEETVHMETFIVLLDYTPQGVQNIKESPARADAFAANAEALGVSVRDIFWTFGDHDGVLVLTAPDDKAVSTLLLALAQDGNVRTRTLKAYGKEEMQHIVSGLVH